MHLGHHTYSDKFGIDRMLTIERLTTTLRFLDSHLSQWYVAYTSTRYVLIVELFPSSGSQSDTKA